MNSRRFIRSPDDPAGGSFELVRRMVSLPSACRSAIASDWAFPERISAALSTYEKRVALNLFFLAQSAMIAEQFEAFVGVSNRHGEEDNEIF